jgi:hypothetical protein
MIRFGRFWWFVDGQINVNLVNWRRNPPFYGDRVGVFGGLMGFELGCIETGYVCVFNYIYICIYKYNVYIYIIRIYIYTYVYIWGERYFTNQDYG